MCLRPVLSSIALCVLSGTALAADGLVPPTSEAVWPQWQARITVSNTVLSPVTLTGFADPGTATRSTLQSGALLSDYYINAPGLRLPASLGGLRATGGLMVGPRGMALGGPAATLRTGQRLGLALQNGASPLASDGTSDTVPYIGVGYTGLSLKGGWGISADLGLVAENPSGAGRVGRALFGNQGWDNAVREMRLSPVLQVGVSYAF